MTAPQRALVYTCRVVHAGKSLGGPGCTAWFAECIAAARPMPAAEVARPGRVMPFIMLKKYACSLPIFWVALSAVPLCRQPHLFGFLLHPAPKQRCTRIGMICSWHVAPSSVGKAGFAPSVYMVSCEQYSKNSLQVSHNAHRLFLGASFASFAGPS